MELSHSEMVKSEDHAIARFETLVREHQAGLRAYVRAIGAQDAWVDDLAQEAFLVAYRRLGDFEAHADFGRWLRGIARNLVLNERRKHARRSRLLQESLVDALWSQDLAGAEGEMPAEQILRTMATCVGDLPVRSRELLARRYAESIDSESLGRFFRMSAAAVRQTLARTRQAVRRCVEEKLGEAWL
ncbi:MAG TPA: sigma-70 family RNA polymerase sigma factor [Opitutaceae bacterium]|nr:sigma-70 family RNA polymerase sigma factor [Opitutaceae bacterium]